MDEARTRAHEPAAGGAEPGLDEATAAAGTQPNAAAGEPGEPGESGAEESPTLAVTQVEALRALLTQPLRVRSLPLVVLAGLGAVAALALAKDFFLPVFVALHAQFVLAPLVRLLRRTGLPTALAASIVMLLALGGIAGSLPLLWGPALELIEDLPRELPRVRYKLESLRRAGEQVSEATRTVEEMAQLGDEVEAPVVAQASGPGLLQTALSGTWSLVGASLLAAAVLFFLLASQDSFLTKLVQVLPRLKDKKRAVEIVRATESQISRYLVTITLVNVALGVAVGLALWKLGLPQPIFWGCAAGLLNFVPYFGTAAGVVLVGLAGLLHFDSLEQTLLPMAAYLGLSTIEGMLLTPMILGRRFAISPVMLFVWLMFWSWMWGIPGGLMAVPMLVVVKIVCTTVPALAPIGVLLGA